MTRPDPLAGNPFHFKSAKNGLVMIYAEKKLARTLKGLKATQFLTKIQMASERERQLIMARVTGQFKFGNER